MFPLQINLLIDDKKIVKCKAYIRDDPDLFDKDFDGTLIYFAYVKSDKLFMIFD